MNQSNQYLETLSTIHSYDDKCLHDFLDIIQELNYVGSKYQNMLTSLSITGNAFREKMVVLAKDLRRKYEKPGFNAHPFEDMIELEFKSWLIDETSKQMA